MKTPKLGCVSIFAVLFLITFIIEKFSPDNKIQDISTDVNSYKYEASHTCENCSKPYTGPGYMHLLDDCRIATGEFANLNNNCSYKCCQESWIRYNQANRY